MTSELDWLERLASAAPTLQMESGPRPYWSQRQVRTQTVASSDLPTTVRRVRVVVNELTDQNWFARTLGYDCFDGGGETGTTLESELDRRLGKPHLLDLDENGWSADDLCDYVEVMYDLAARPSRSQWHSWNNCGLHPTAFHRSSGRQLFCWRINQILDQSTLGLRLADTGEDVGRMVRALPSAVEELAEELGDIEATGDPQVPHAISLYRARGATREDKKSAIVSLGSYLEQHREAFTDRVTKPVADPLFEVLNKFALRHRRADQIDGYPDELLDWVFRWSLDTVRLVQQIISASGTGTAP